VPVSDADAATKGIDVMNTWGKRCNKLILFTEATHKGLPTVALGVKDSGNYDLTNKIFTSLYHLYKNELENYQWFVKADTDTYVVLENLRYMLSGHKPDEPLYFGHHFKVSMVVGL